MAKLFSSQLTTEMMIKERFLPTLKTVATCKWNSFSAGVAVYLLVMLLHKMPQKGLSLVINTLSKEVLVIIEIDFYNYREYYISSPVDTQAYYQVIGEAVTKECEIDTWPKFMVKMPKPDKILSPEDFRELLVQDPKALGNGWIGNDSKLNWIFLLAYSVRDFKLCILS